MNFSSGFCHRIRRGIIKRLYERGLSIPILVPNGEYPTIKVALDRKLADACIGIFDSADRVAMKAVSLPAVSVSRRDRVSHLARVASDDLEIGRLAARTFRAKGFTRFGFAGYAEHEYSSLREAGFREELGEAAHEFFSWNGRDSNWQPSRQDLRQHLAQTTEPVAFLAANDTLARRICIWSLETGVGVPDPIALMGVDADGDNMEPSPVKLSSINPDFESIGARAIDLILEMASGIRAPGDPTVDESVLPLGVIEAESTSSFGANDARINAARRIIRQHALSAMNIGEMLDDIPLSRRHLERGYRKAFGTSPAEELRELRLHHAARQLLENPHHPVNVIAAASGYPEAKTFNAAFRQRYGCTPTQWRQQAPAKDS